MTKSYYTPVFYRLRDPERFPAIHDEFLKAGPNIYFTGDNLVSFGRAMSFLDDKPFMAAFHGAKPDAIEMSLIWRLHILCWAARRAMTLEGDFVEAACYKGFTLRVVCDLLDFGQSDKQYWAYDLFDMPSEPKLRLQAHGPDLYQQVVARFADLSNVRIIKGRIPASFALGEPERIAFMHIDMNNAEAELATLERFFDRLVAGGTIILDDYGWVDFGEQRIVADRFLASRGLQVLELPTGQGMVIK